VAESRRTTPAALARARRALAAERARLDAAGIGGELVLTGGSSIVGVRTKGDIDLHLRVPAADFERVIAAMPAVMPAAHPEIWTDGFAAFERDGDPPVGIAVTARGSEHDRRFTVSWRRLAADPALRDEYSELKDAPDPEAAKSAFFDRIAGDGAAAMPE
jgi:GrpB-like predicted nucleotidyltransferase (UPF0157 family)